VGAFLLLYGMQRLPLWGSWRGAPERVRTLPVKRRRSDSIALTKGLLIAAQRLSGDGLALSVIAARCQLPQRGSHWRAGQAHAGRAKFILSGNSSALLQRFTAA